MELYEDQSTKKCSCKSSCDSSEQVLSIPKAPYIKGLNLTMAGAVPRVATELTMKDNFGAWKVRWGYKRMDYKVVPGLYSVGKPDDNSPVLVTSNYKLTFDSLRKELGGLNLWILILDTKGVNVWCAAGKGTFGTEELIRRVKASRLHEIVKHRTLILPQLGATGVAAHVVAKECGFHVVYGPVRAADIKAFFEAGMKATREMRMVRFTFKDRAVLTPVDLVQYIKPLMILFGILFILNAAGLTRFGVIELISLLGAVITGCVLTPILLPWIPGHAFAFKGALLGVLWTAAILLIGGGFSKIGIPESISLFLLLPAVSGYAALNFTGSSTYTSPSGVNKEMRVALPAMLIAAVTGGILLFISGVLKVFM